MRKVILQMQLSIDGLVAGENGAMDWMTWNWDDGLKAYIKKLTDSIDCIILGRVLAEGFIPHWASVAANPDNSEFSAGQKFTETKKVIFTNTLDHIGGTNSELAKGDLVEEIAKLKNQAGKNIIVYGGGSFVSSLITENLIDEYHFCINPVILGKGLPIFQDISTKLDLEFVNAHPFDCGITVTQYKRKEK